MLLDVLGDDLRQQIYRHVASLSTGALARLCLTTRGDLLGAPELTDLIRQETLQRCCPARLKLTYWLEGDKPAQRPRIEYDGDQHRLLKAFSLRLQPQELVRLSSDLDELGRVGLETGNGPGDTLGYNESASHSVFTRDAAWAHSAVDAMGCACVAGRIVQDHTWDGPLLVELAAPWLRLESFFSEGIFEPPDGIGRTLFLYEVMPYKVSDATKLDAFRAIRSRVCDLHQGDAERTRVTMLYLMYHSANYRGSYVPLERLMPEFGIRPSGVLGLFIEDAVEIFAGGGVQNDSDEMSDMEAVCDNLERFVSTLTFPNGLPDAEEIVRTWLGWHFPADALSCSFLGDQCRKAVHPLCQKLLQASLAAATPANATRYVELTASLLSWVP